MAGHLIFPGMGVGRCYLKKHLSNIRYVEPVITTPLQLWKHHSLGLEVGFRHKDMFRLSKQIMVGGFNKSFLTIISM